MFLDHIQYNPTFSFTKYYEILGVAAEVGNFRHLPALVVENRLWMGAIGHNNKNRWKLYVIDERLI